MSTFVIPRNQYTDTDGSPLAGGKLYFYETGTTTPLATYSDKALTAANANPVIADSNGNFGRIFLQTDEQYRVRLTDADDVQIWQEDNVNALQLTSSDDTTRLQQVASNPLDYGALGNGVTSESSEVQSAIDNATRVVDLLGKTYRCDTGLTVPSNRHIKNGTFDHINQSSGVAWTIGTSNVQTTSNYVLTANALKHATEVAVSSTSGLSSGQVVLVRSSGSWSGSYSLGSIHKIEKIASPNISLSEKLEAAFNTADTAQIYTLTGAVKDIVFENCTFLMPASSGVRGVDVYAADNIEFRNCRFVDPNQACLSFLRCYNARVVDCEFSRCDSIFTLISLASENRNVTIERCRAIGTNCRFISGYISAQQGQCIGLEIRDCEALEMGNQALEFGVGVFQLSIAGGYYSERLVLSARDAQIRNVRFGETSSQLSIYAVTGEGTLDIRHCHFEPNAGAMEVESYDRLNVVGCYFEDCSSTAIIVGDCETLVSGCTLGSSSTGEFVGVSFFANNGRGVRLIGNYIEGGAGPLVEFNGNAETDGYLIATGNYFGSGVQAFQVQTLQHVLIAENQFDVIATDGIRVADCRVVSISRNMIRSASGQTKLIRMIDIAESIEVSGNHLVQVSDGIWLETCDAEAVSVSGNLVDGVTGSAARCLYLDATITSAANVCGNVFRRGDDLGANVEISNAAGGLMASNQILNGTVGILCSEAGFAIGHNQISGQTEQFVGGTAIARAAVDLHAGASTFAVRTDSVIVDADAATKTATGLRPADAFVLGVTTLVTEALSGGGVTGYQVGDGSDADRYGTVSGTAAFSTGTANPQANPTGFQLGSAGDVVVTFTGGTPTAGKIRINIHYIAAKATVGVLP